MTKPTTAPTNAAGVRLGLCCIFQQQPIKFRNTTVKSISGMSRKDGVKKLSGLCLANAEALQRALEYCAEQGIGCFRINSQILPLKTHETCGYAMEELPHGDEIVKRFKACGKFAKRHNVRTCFHPDQFLVLNSPREEVVQRSIAELEYQSEVAQWVSADVVNIHGGGAYGDKEAALGRFAETLSQLSKRARSRLTVENDDVTYTPADLLPLCQSTGIPLVYDIHHHRCNPDGMSEEEATNAALATWNREPMFHLSSPLEGWKGPKPQRHHDYIDVTDFPGCWRELDLTVEVEAKAKELAVLKLKKQLAETWSAYIVQCADGSFYTGVSNELENRIAVHNAGKGAKYTRSRLPVKLVYHESLPNKSAALKRELAIKGLSRSAKEELIASGNATE
ncbi:UV DNA damage repair endonuclease UvsE [Blastopirellula retiformator]|uniref:UV DNA damage endonuclease n=1 Tax=Blastopirellula retiformator TaxID=2527970 RepID=A0A5C5V1H5_9BACT|nr:UV DNA damage repair endonuclease UvsE [Blastopirellula retiformator]TWT31545.1 UV DNA damage endonuclease [Blastopirellula retiformator]